MSDELRKGWAEVGLRECVDVLDNVRVPVNSDERAKRQGDVPYYGATGQVGWIDEALFNEELLLIGEDGAPFFDKSKPIAYIIRGKSWVNNHAHVLRAKSGITSNQYLKSYLDWFDFNDYVNGTTRLKLTQGAMNRIPVRIAPLPEQRRIVAKLETLLGKVDASQQRLAKIPVLLKRFRQSVLGAACSGRLTADWREENPDVEPYSVETVESEDEFPANWSAARIGNLITLVTSGSRGWAKYYSDSGSTFIRAQNINSDFLNLEDIAFVRPLVSAEGLRTKVQQHDILITITGANVTKSALVEKKIEDAYVSQHVALVRLKDNRLAKFLFHSVVSPAHGRKQLLAAAYGQGKPGLNLENIREVVVGLPPFPEQQEIVRRVESLFALADQLELRLAKARGQVEKLTPSLLARAFAGQLVPQDPTDEPAEKLLERIKTNQTNPGERKKHAKAN